MPAWLRDAHQSPPAAPVTSKSNSAPMLQRPPGDTRRIEVVPVV
jgi:hypothetical protein